MKKIAQLIWTEPAICVGVISALLAAASGVWDLPALAFGAAAFAALGSIFVRQNVTPVK